MKFPFTFLLFSTLVWGQRAEMVPWVDRWARVYGIEKELVEAVIEAESGWNPRAISPAGAAGLMQLMPDTAAAFGVMNRFDVAQNIRGGVAYLAWLREVCGEDRRLILASYVAGPNLVCRRGLSYSSPQVTNYVRRVAHFYRRNRWEAILKQGETP